MRDMSRLFPPSHRPLPLPSILFMHALPPPPLSLSISLRIHNIHTHRFGQTWRESGRRYMEQHPSTRPARYQCTRLDLKACHLRCDSICCLAKWSRCGMRRDITELTQLPLMYPSRPFSECTCVMSRARMSHDCAVTHRTKRCIRVEKGVLWSEYWSAYTHSTRYSTSHSHRHMLRLSKRHIPRVFLRVIPRVTF